MKKMIFPAAMFIVLLLQGCATSMSTSQYTVDITTSQSQERAFRVYNRNGEYVHLGKTPMMVTLPAQSSEFFTPEIYTVKFDNGKERTITATLSPWYWGNVVNIVGFAVDGITGCMWTLPARVNIDLPESRDPNTDKLRL